MSLSRPWLDRRRTLLAGAAGLLALLAILSDLTPLLRGPAPYPPEWRWELRRGSTSGRYAAALAPGAALVALLVLLGTERPRRRPRQAAWVALSLAVPLGLLLQLGLLELEPDGAWRTLVQRTMSRTVTSYYSVALSPEGEHARVFLDRHAELLPELRRSAKHAATHPPGPVLFFRGLLALFEARPALAQAVIDGAGLGDAERRPAARAAALAGPLLLLLACAAAAIPVAALARMAGAEEVEASRVAVLWTLLPGPALMAPQFDQALALPVAAGAAALAAAALSPSASRRTAWAVAAGMCAALAVFVSYGAVVFLGVAAGAALAAVVADRSALPRTSGAAAVALATAALLLGITMALGHEPVRAALTALRIHREVYTQPRSYLVWLAFNPLDLALFVGVPVAVLYALALARSVRAVRAGSAVAADRFVLFSGAGLALLLLSGTVRGEVGRIWIPLMPTLLVAALAPRAAATASEEPRWAAPALGAMLLALCLALRVRWEVG